MEALAADDPIRGALEELHGEIVARKPGSRAMIESLVRRCLILLLRRYFEHAASRPSWLAPLEDARVSRVVAAMQARPEEAFTLAALAEVAGMSRSVFAARFANVLGESPMEFLKTLRLVRAAQLLARTDLPVKNIAAQVGYSSRSSSRARSWHITGRPPRVSDRPRDRRRTCVKGAPAGRRTEPPATSAAAPRAEGRTAAPGGTPRRSRRGAGGRRPVSTVMAARSRPRRRLIGTRHGQRSPPDHVHRRRRTDAWARPPCAGRRGPRRHRRGPYLVRWRSRCASVRGLIPSMSSPARPRARSSRRRAHVPPPGGDAHCRSRLSVGPDTVTAPGPRWWAAMERSRRPAMPSSSRLRWRAASAPHPRQAPVPTELQPLDGSARHAATTRPRRRGVHRRGACRATALADGSARCGARTNSSASLPTSLRAGSASIDLRDGADPARRMSRARCGGRGTSSSGQVRDQARLLDDLLDLDANRARPDGAPACACGRSAWSPGPAVEVARPWIEERGQRLVVSVLDGALSSWRYPSGSSRS